MSDRDYWRDGQGRTWGFWATYPATKAVCIGLAAIHFLMTVVRAADLAAAHGIERFLALTPEHVLEGFRVWQLATCGLLHAPGLSHIFWNCFGLVMFGRLVEQRLGARKYLRFLLGAQLAASLAFLLLAAIQDTRNPMIGASGIDFGVLLLAAFWYPRLQVLVMFVLAAPLWIVAGIWVLIEVMLLLGQGGGIAHSAHLGGALYGFFYHRFAGELEHLSGFFDRWQRKRRQRQIEEEREAREELRGKVDRILDKVNREGMAALTDEERRALKEASEKLRR